MKMQNIDYSLYLVTDRGLARGRPTLDIVQAAVEGGVTCVQLREKECSTLDFIEQALAIKDFLKARGVPLIINDRVDVALAIEADGVHLGQTDMPLEIAKRIIGDSMIIGISAESLEDAVAAEKGGADYLGVSPIYATPTKSDTAPEKTLTIRAVASAAPSSRPTTSMLAPRPVTRKTGSRLWISSDETSISRLTNPRAQMLPGR